jgi:hypothetical protein
MAMRSPAPAALVVALALATPARADDASRRADAKAIATRGDSEFYAGRCDRAIPLWREAEAAYHAPTILLRIARCEAILGRVVAASSLLDSIAREPLASDAPAAFVLARDQAKREAPAVRARVATLVLDVDARGRSPVVIEIDGATRSGGPAFEVDPGARSLRVRAGASSWQSTVSLRDGERVAMRVSLTPGHEGRAPTLARGLGASGIVAGGAAVAVGLALSIDRGSPAIATAGTATLATGAVLAVAGAVTILLAPPRGDAWRVRVGATSATFELRY